MNRINIVVVLLLSIVFVTSCSKRLRISDIVDPNNFEMQTFTFDQLDTRARIRYDDGRQKVALNATIRMKKDSVIWISLSPMLGIEVARGLITQDSVIFMDRINQEYTVFDYKGLSEHFNFKLNYHIIQSILIGEIPWEAKLDDRVRRSKDHYLLRQEIGRIQVDNYISPESMKVERIHMRENPSKNNLTFEYRNFQVVERKIFPYSSNIVLNYFNFNREYTTSINIDHSKVEVDGKNSLSFPFIIPDRYARK
jgi:hypothetical protein